MSNLDPAPEAINLTPGVTHAGRSEGGAPPGRYRAVDVIEARKAAIGDGTEVRRLLPHRTLRTISAWCFGFEVAVPGGDDFVLPARRGAASAVRA